MAENSKISWTDHTSSPWYGCNEVHEGCDNCYARELSKRNPKTLGEWGEDGTRVKSKSFIKNLRTWNREAENAGKIVSVFPSLCDPFEDRPELVEWRNEMFAVIDECPHVRLLLLTKRPENIRKMIPPYSYHACETGDCPHWDAADCDKNTGYRDNVWLLTSVSDQATADAMIPELLKARDLTPVLGASAEPLLGPVDLIPYLGGNSYRCKCGFHHTENELIFVGGNDWKCAECGQWCNVGGTLDWIITGGESGPHARPHNIRWSWDIGQQCQAANVAWWHKQHGSKPWDSEADCGVIGKKLWTREELANPNLQSMAADALEHCLETLYVQLKDRSGSDPSEWGTGWLQQMPGVTHG